MRARLREATEQRVAQPPIDIELVRLDGVTIEVQVATVPVVFEGAPALITFAHDVTSTITRAACWNRQSHCSKRQAGGQIDVERTPQRGTTFRILLPAAEPSPQAA